MEAASLTGYAVEDRQAGHVGRDERRIKACFTKPRITPEARCFEDGFNPIARGTGHLGDVAGQDVIRFDGILIKGTSTMTNLFKRFAADESGATAIEYGLIASLIAVAIIASLNLMTTNLKATLGAIATSLKTS